jgi:putative effector of murein hydrolase
VRKLLAILVLDSLHKKGGNGLNKLLGPASVALAVQTSTSTSLSKLRGKI